MVLEEGRRRRETGFDKALKVLLGLAFVAVALAVAYFVAMVIIAVVGSWVLPA